MREISRYLKIIFKVVGTKFFDIRVPLIVGWALTNRCNIKCKYCNRWMYETEEMDTKEVLLTISTLAEMGTYKINFTGGEPLLREDLDEIIRLTIKKRIKVAINSNGTLVPDKIDILKGIDTLGLSLDGPEDIQDYVRCKGSYKAVIRAAEAAKERDIKVIFNTLITSVNISYLNHILDIAQKFKSAVMFSLIDLIPFASKEVEMIMPPLRGYYSAIDRLITKKRKGNKNILNSLSALYYLKKWPINRGISKCVAGLIYCRIEPNGDVYSCARVENMTNPVSCKQEGFKKAFLNLQKQYPCRMCWCGNRIEMNHIFSLKPNSVLNLVNFEFKKRC